MRPLARALALLLLVSLPLASRATAALTFEGIDGATSTVMQEGQSSFSGLGLRARLKSDQLVPGISLMPTVEFWRNTSTIQPFGITATRKDATLGFDVRYAFPQQGWVPYAGAGFALHFLSSAVNAPSLGLNGATDGLVKGGLAALAGVTFPFTGHLENYIELKYHHVPDYRQLKINFGLGYSW